MKTPWDTILTPEKKKEHGPYADYVAWEQWMDGDTDGYDIIEALEAVDDCILMPHLYALFVQVAKYAAGEINEEVTASPP